MKDDRARLDDILEAIERIERYAQRGRPAFETDELLQTWLIHHIQIIGEAARKLSETARSASPEIPWRQIMTMRNVLVHDYFGVDMEEVWVAVQRDIPDLKRKVQSLLHRLPSQ
ncbi:MAG: DUF86 domain-containing protein [Nitrospira sp.]|nr:DUF86 domain-containing protein [Nitrospira sp.]